LKDYFKSEKMSQDKMHCNKISFYWFKMQQHLIVVMCFSIGWDGMSGPALSIIVYVSVKNHDNLIIRSLEKFFKWKIIVSIKRNICYVLPVRVLLVQFSSVQSSPVQSCPVHWIQYAVAKRLGKLVRYIKGSLYWGAFPYIYHYWAEEYRSLYLGLRYIEVR